MQETYIDILKNISKWNQDGYFSNNEQIIANLYNVLCEVNPRYIPIDKGTKRDRQSETDALMIKWEKTQSSGYHGIVKRSDGAEGWYCKNSDRPSQWFNLPPNFAENEETREMFDNICIAKIITGYFVSRLDPKPFIDTLGTKRFKEHKNWSF